MKAVKVKLQETKPDRVETFEKNAQAYAKKIVANFKDFEFVGRTFSRSAADPIQVHGRGDEPRWDDCSA
jgi:hypothetical protein